MSLSDSMLRIAEDMEKHAKRSECDMQTATVLQGFIDQLRDAVKSEEGCMNLFTPSHVWEEE